jgi:uncharacterized repeat protein (TIGR03803 family)
VSWIVLFACLVTPPAVAQTYQLVFSFRNQGQPYAGLIQGSDGSFYGTTCWGGASGVGTVFRVDAHGVVTLHSFGYADGANPEAGLIQASDGSFYGTASRGGTANLGTVFRMDQSGVVERLHNFTGSDGATPVASLIEASDGDFYGTTSEGGASGKGTVFRIDSSGQFTTLHDFGTTDGAAPRASLIQAQDGDFYGTTSGGGIDDQGTVFRMDTAGNLTTLHAFVWADGINPQASLLHAGDGAFYGTTFSGGAQSAGTIFRIGSDGSFETLYSFPTPGNGPAGPGANPLAALIQANDGYLYGTTTIGGDTNNGDGWGTIFRVDTAGSLTTLYQFSGLDGANPRAGVVQAGDGNFYGTTFVSGDSQQKGGTVFEMASGGDLTTLHEFPGSEGESPQALIQASDGNIYGMTYSGGAEGNGSIFRVTPSGAFATLHTFAGIEGRGPQAALLEASDGFLYGATLTGGVYGGGAIFRSDFDGHVTLIHDFDGADGAGPISALIEATDGYLYGTAYNGGDTDQGTIFRMSLSLDFTTLHTFHGADGASPAAALLEASDGNLYGTTWGPFYSGTVFRISLGGDFFSLHTFGGDEGRYPYDSLIEATDGNFYATTYGSSPWPGFGTVFRIDSSGSLTTVHTFEVPEAYGPQGGLVQTSDGYLYGSTVAGGIDNGLSGYGTLFKMTFAGDTTLIHLFNGFDGVAPTTTMIRTNDGSLWGTAGGGPLGGLGVIYRLSPDEVAANAALPTSGLASGGTALQVLGGGFASGATVTVGGDSGTEVTILDPTFLYLFTPALSPGTLNDVTVTNPGMRPATATRPKAYFADFLDVPQTDPFHDFVEKIFRAGITAGCGAGSYCPADAVTRAQMAVFLLKAEHGSGYAPPPCTGVFGDVSCPSLFADWIEQLAHEGITAGCGGGNYCPTTPVTRAQMAVFLLKAEHGAGYAPPACTGVFTDVTCPSLFANWIEQLAAEGITGGCGGGNYCPNNPNTRGQMAVFLTKTFHL